MRSLSNSKIVKSYRITLDDKNYKLSPEIFAVDEARIKRLKGDGVEEVEEGEPVDDSPSFEEQMAQQAQELENMRNGMIVQSQEDAKEILETAKHDAQKIISDAYTQAQEILENAKREGFDNGEREGFEQGRAIADGLINDAMDIKESLQQKKEMDLKGNESEVVKLIIEISERILNKRIEEDYEVIQGLVQSALDKCVYTENLILRVSSHDFDYAISSKNKFLASAESVRDIEIREDVSLVPGSCVIDSDSGSIDSSVWTQFEHIRDKYLDLLRSE